jgi:hypothetical protein
MIPSEEGSFEKEWRHVLPLPLIGAAIVGYLFYRWAIDFLLQCLFYLAVAISFIVLLSLAILR